MTTAQIQYFLTAAEKLSFTAAAEQLYITQPSLSRQIAAIEAELGAKLFQRANNGITLTDAGRALFEKLSVLYEDYQNIVQEVRDISSGSKGHLNLGILEDQYMNDALIQELRHLLQENPGCELNIARHDSRTLFSGLNDGSIDAGLMLVYDEFLEYGFEYLNLDTSPAQLAINRHLPAANWGSMTMESMNELLEEIPLAMVTQNQFPEPLQDSLLKNMPFSGLGESSKVQLLPAISSVSLYVAAGLAVTLTNKGNLLVNDPNIVLLPVDGMRTMTQGLVWRRNGQNFLMRKLVERLHREHGYELMTVEGGLKQS